MWYAKNIYYPYVLQQDMFIREFIYKNIKNTFISSIEIKRKLDETTIDIRVAKPKRILKKVSSLRNDLLNLLKQNDYVIRNLTINVIEVISPSLNSRFLVDYVRQQLEKRTQFKKAMKTGLNRATKAGAKGIKIQISGRLNGAEMARTEWAREGRVPLHTLSADIDYYNHEASKTL